MVSDTGHDIEQRVAELESRLAFQEHLLEKLDQVVSRQDREILALQQQLAELAARVKEFENSSGAAAAPADFEIPPHY
jgi:SlyX protein